MASITVNVMQHVVGLREVDNGDCTLNRPTSETVIMKSG